MSVREVADEILRGSRLSLGRPLCQPGIAVVPVIVPRLLEWSLKSLRMPWEGRETCTKIVDDLPQNTCGAILVDSRGRVVAFKLFHGIQEFWERIDFIEDIALKYQKEFQRQLPEATVLGKAIVFLARLRSMGPESILSEDSSDFFAVGFTDHEKAVSDTDSSRSTRAAVFYGSLQD
ncbi:MAG: hypothetical protein ACE5H4_06190 [Candidatus Thorarchaeota archaeon]